MCLLVVYRSGALPNAAALSRAASRNPDGYGWAIHTGSEIITYRTLDASDGVASFCRARAEHPTGSALWHARFTTHGVTDLSNVHPFPVGGDSRLVLAHNGVLPLAPTGSRSDTHEFAAELLRVEDLDNESALDWLGQWASGSKLAILSAHPDTSSDLYIVNEHLGHWSDDEPGVWYSNDAYRERVGGWWSSDPRESAIEHDVLDALDALDDLDAPGAFDPWDYYRDGEPMAECVECGTLWPDWVDWCDSCGWDMAGAFTFGVDS